MVYKWKLELDESLTPFHKACSSSKVGAENVFYDLVCLHIADAILSVILQHEDYYMQHQAFAVCT